MTIHQIDPNFSGSNWSIYWETIKQQQSFSLESIHQTKNGQPIPVEINFNYLQFDEQEYNCAIARNITERKQIEVKLTRANEELQRLANYDSLTQLANRRCFDEYFAREWQRMSREQKPLSLILCDIDYFKNYNDYYGHQAGDNCLRQVAQIIDRTIKRSADLVARYGGEEFAIILPNTTSEGALYLAETIRSNLEQLELEHVQSQISSYVTLSLGIYSLIPPKNTLPHIAIEQADKALYEAKKQGRNRCYAIDFNQHLNFPSS
jgi:diguanylate cyclase (GGDEF)-like protein